MNRVTVLMRTKDSAWVLPQTLQALLSQEGVAYDLLVVDSGSTDPTRKLFAGVPHTLRTLPAEDYFPGKVLNEAIAETKTSLIVFLNSDTVLLGPHALARLVASFDDATTQAAFGRQVPRPEAHLWVRKDYATSFPSVATAPEWMTLSLPIAAMRRSAWEQQPFSTAAWGSEDTAWGKAARERGWKIAYCPDCVAMHSHNYTYRQLYGRRYIEGESDALMGASGRPHPLRRYLGDLAYAWRTGARPESPAIRFVEAWGYYWGYRHGQERKRTGDADASHAQRVVLERQ